MKDLHENLKWLEEHGFEKTHAWLPSASGPCLRRLQDETDFHLKTFDNEASIYVWRNILEDLWYAVQTDDAAETFLKSGVSEGCGFTAESAVKDCIENRKKTIEALSQKIVEI